MAELKTQKNDGDVEAFLNTVDAKRREDCRTIVEIMQEVTGEEPAMWGPTIVGFGSCRYQYADGRENDWFVTGFSPRKQNLTLYIMGGIAEDDPLMARLGKSKTGKSCLYIKKLDDIDLDVLKELIQKSAARAGKHGGC